MSERRIYMILYGQKLLYLGIGIIILVLIISSIFLTVYFIGSSKLKKKLESEYGRKKY